MKLKAPKTWQLVLIIVSVIVLAIGGSFLAVYLKTGFEPVKTPPSDIAIEDLDGFYNATNSQYEVSNDFKLKVTTQTESVNQNEITLSFPSGTYEQELEDGMITDGNIIVPKTVKIGEEIQVKLNKIAYNGDEEQMINKGGISTLVFTTQNVELSSSQVQIAVDVPVVEIKVEAYNTSTDNKFELKEGAWQVSQAMNFELRTTFYPAESRYLFSDQSNDKIATKREKRVYFSPESDKINFEYNDGNVYFSAKDDTSNNNIVDAYTFTTAAEQQYFDKAFVHLEGKALYDQTIKELSSNIAQGGAKKTQASIDVIEADIGKFTIKSIGKDSPLEFKVNKLFKLSAGENLLSDAELSISIRDSQDKDLSGMIKNVGLRITSIKADGDKSAITGDEEIAKYVTVRGGDTQEFGGKKYILINSKVKDLKYASWEISTGGEYKIEAEIKLFFKDAEGITNVFDGETDRKIYLVSEESTEEDISWNDHSDINLAITYDKDGKPLLTERPNLKALTSVPSGNVYQTKVFFIYFSSSIPEGKTIDDYVAVSSVGVGNYDVNGEYKQLYPLDGDSLIVKDAISFNLIYATVRTDAYGKYIKAGDSYRLEKISSPIEVNVKKTLQEFESVQFEIAADYLIGETSKYYAVPTGVENAFNLKITLKNGDSAIFDAEKENLSFISTTEENGEKDDDIGIFKFGEPQIEGEVVTIAVSVKSISISEESGKQYFIRVIYNNSKEDVYRTAQPNDADVRASITIYQQNPVRIENESLSGKTFTVDQKMETSGDISTTIKDKEGEVVTDLNTLVEQTKIFDTYEREFSGEYSVSSSDSKLVIVTDNSITFGNGNSDKPVTVTIKAGSQEIEFYLTITSQGVSSIEVAGEEAQDLSNPKYSLVGKKDANVILKNKEGQDGLLKVYVAGDIYDPSAYTLTLQNTLNDIDEMIEFTYSDADPDDPNSVSELTGFNIKDDFYQEVTLRFLATNKNNTLSFTFDITISPNAHEEVYAFRDVVYGEEEINGNKVDQKVADEDKGENFDSSAIYVYAAFPINLNDYLKVRLGDEKTDPADNEYIDWSAIYTNYDLKTSGDNKNIGTIKDGVVTFNDVYVPKTYTFSLYANENQSKYAYYKEITLTVCPNFKLVRKTGQDFSIVKINKNNTFSDYFEIQRTTLGFGKDKLNPLDVSTLEFTKYSFNEYFECADDEITINKTPTFNGDETKKVIVWAWANPENITGDDSKVAALETELSLGLGVDNLTKYSTVFDTSSMIKYNDVNSLLISNSKIDINFSESNPMINGEKDTDIKVSLTARQNRYTIFTDGYIIFGDTTNASIVAGDDVYLKVVLKNPTSGYDIAEYHVPYVWSRVGNKVASYDDKVDIKDTIENNGENYATVSGGKNYYLLTPFEYFFFGENDEDLLIVDDKAGNVLTKGDNGDIEITVGSVTKTITIDETNHALKVDGNTNPCYIGYYFNIEVDGVKYYYYYSSYDSSNGAIVYKAYLGTGGKIKVMWNDSALIESTEDVTYTVGNGIYGKMLMSLGECNFLTGLKASDFGTDRSEGPTIGFEWLNGQKYYSIENSMLKINNIVGEDSDRFDTYFVIKQYAKSSSGVATLEYNFYLKITPNASSDGNVTYPFGGETENITIDNGDTLEINMTEGVFGADTQNAGKVRIANTFTIGSTKTELENGFELKIKELSIDGTNISVGNGSTAGNETFTVSLDGTKVTFRNIGDAKNVSVVLIMEYLYMYGADAEYSFSINSSNITYKIVASNVSTNSSLKQDSDGVWTWTLANNTDAQTLNITTKQYNESGASSDVDKTKIETLMTNNLKLGYGTYKDVFIGDNTYKEGAQRSITINGVKYYYTTEYVKDETSDGDGPATVAEGGDGQGTEGGVSSDTPTYHWELKHFALASNPDVNLISRNLKAGDKLTIEGTCFTENTTVEFTESGNLKLSGVKCDAEIKVEYDYSAVTPKLSITLPGYVANEMTKQVYFSVNGNTIATINVVIPSTVNASRAKYSCDDEVTTLTAGKTYDFNELVAITSPDANFSAETDTTNPIQLVDEEGIVYSSNKKHDYVTVSGSWITIANALEKQSVRLKFNYTYKGNAGYVIYDYEIAPNVAFKNKLENKDIVAGTDYTGISFSDLQNGTSVGATNFELTATYDSSLFESIKMADGKITVETKYVAQDTNASVTLKVSCKNNDEVLFSVEIAVTFIIHPAVQLQVNYPSPTGDTLTYESVVSGAKYKNFLTSAAEFADKARFEAAEGSLGTDGKVSYGAYAAIGSIATSAVTSGTINIKGDVPIEGQVNFKVLTYNNMSSVKIDNIEILAKSTVTPAISTSTFIFTRGTGSGLSYVTLQITYKGVTKDYTVYVFDTVVNGYTNATINYSDGVETVYSDRVDTTNLFGKRLLELSIDLSAVKDTICYPHIVTVDGNNVTVSNKLLQFRISESLLGRASIFVDSGLASVDLGDDQQIWFLTKEYAANVDVTSAARVGGVTFKRVASRVEFTYALSGGLSERIDYARMNVGDNSQTTDSGITTYNIGYRFGDSGNYNSTVNYKIKTGLDIEVRNACEQYSASTFVEIVAHKTEYYRIVEQAQIRHKSTGEYITAESMGNATLSLEIVDVSSNSNYPGFTSYNGVNFAEKKTYKFNNENDKPYVLFSDITDSATKKVYDYTFYAQGCAADGDFALLKITYKIIQIINEKVETVETFYVALRIIPNYTVSLGGNVIVQSNSTSGGLVEGGIVSNEERPYEFTPDNVSKMSLSSSETNSGLVSAVRTGFNATNVAYSFSYSITVGDEYNTSSTIDKLNLTAEDSGWTPNDKKTPKEYTNNSNTISIIPKTVVFGVKKYMVEIVDDFGYTIHFYFNLVPASDQTPEIYEDSSTKIFTEGQGFDIGLLYDEITITKDEKETYSASIDYNKVPGDDTNTEAKNKIIVKNIEAWGLTNGSEGIPEKIEVDGLGNRAKAPKFHNVTITKITFKYESDLGTSTKSFTVNDTSLATNGDLSWEDTTGKYRSHSNSTFTVPTMDGWIYGTSDQQTISIIIELKYQNGSVVESCVITYSAFIARKAAFSSNDSVVTDGISFNLSSYINVEGKEGTVTFYDDTLAVTVPKSGFVMMSINIKEDDKYKNVIQTVSNPNGQTNVTKYLSLSEIYGKTIDPCNNTVEISWYGSDGASVYHAGNPIDSVALGVINVDEDWFEYHILEMKSGEATTYKVVEFDRKNVELVSGSKIEIGGKAATVGFDIKNSPPKLTLTIDSTPYTGSYVEKDGLISQTLNIRNINETCEGIDTDTLYLESAQRLPSSGTEYKVKKSYIIGVNGTFYQYRHTFTLTPRFTSLNNGLGSATAKELNGVWEKGENGFTIELSQWAGNTSGYGAVTISSATACNNSQDTINLAALSKDDLKSLKFTVGIEGDDSSEIKINNDNGTITTGKDYVLGSNKYILITVFVKVSGGQNGEFAENDAYGNVAYLKELGQLRVYLTGIDYNNLVSGEIDVVSGDDIDLSKYIQIDINKYDVEYYSDSDYSTKLTDGKDKIESDKLGTVEKTYYVKATESGTEITTVNATVNATEKAASTNVLYGQVKLTFNIIVCVEETKTIDVVSGQEFDIVTAGVDYDSEKVDVEILPEDNLKIVIPANDKIKVLINKYLSDGTWSSEWLTYENTTDLEQTEFKYLNLDDVEKVEIQYATLLDQAKVYYLCGSGWQSIDENAYTYIDKKHKVLTERIDDEIYKCHLVVYGGKLVDKVEGDMLDTTWKIEGWNKSSDSNGAISWNMLLKKTYVDDGENEKTESNCLSYSKGSFKELTSSVIGAWLDGNKGTIIGQVGATRTYKIKVIDKTSNKEIGKERTLTVNVIAEIENQIIAVWGEEIDLKSYVEFGTKYNIEFYDSDSKLLTDGKDSFDYDAKTTTSKTYKIKFINKTDTSKVVEETVEFEIYIIANYIDSLSVMSGEEVLLDDLFEYDREKYSVEYYSGSSWLEDGKDTITGEVGETKKTYKVKFTDEDDNVIEKEVRFWLHIFAKVNDPISVQSGSDVDLNDYVALDEGYTISYYVQRLKVVMPANTKVVISILYQNQNGKHTGELKEFSNDINEEKVEYVDLLSSYKTLTDIPIETYINYASTSNDSDECAEIYYYKNGWAYMPCAALSTIGENEYTYQALGCYSEDGKAYTLLAIFDNEVVSGKVGETFTHGGTTYTVSTLNRLRLILTYGDNEISSTFSVKIYSIDPITLTNGKDLVEGDVGTIERYYDIRISEGENVVYRKIVKITYNITAAQATGE